MPRLIVGRLTSGPSSTEVTLRSYEVRTPPPESHWRDTDAGEVVITDRLTARRGTEMDPGKNRKQFVQVVDKALIQRLGRSSQACFCALDCDTVHWLLTKVSLLIKKATSKTVY